MPSATDDPAKINVEDACRRYLAGETSVAQGIFADVRVGEKWRMGQTCSPAPSPVAVRLRVAAPAWVKPRRALVFVNGQPADARAPLDERIRQAAAQRPLIAEYAQHALSAEPSKGR